MRKLLVILAVLAVVATAVSMYMYRTITSGTTMQVKVYFANNALDPEITCQKVFPVERTITRTTAVGTEALKELLKGTTDTEEAQGYITTLPEGVHLKSLSIVSGTARADFDAALEYQVGGSCRVGFIRRQITATLEQFPTVQRVIVSIDGRTEDILQP